MREKLILLSFLFGFAFADVVTISWTGGCNGGPASFALNFAATNAEGTFKPDGANGAATPCNEWFESCFSFVDAQGNVIVFPGITTSNFYNIDSGFFNNTPGVITAVIAPEDPGFAAGSIPTAGAYYLATGQSFTVSCTSVPNFKVRSNYLLTATNVPGTNPNYVRTLDQVTDSGTLGFGGVVAPYSTPPASFAVGQSACNSAAMTPILYSFPSYGTALPGATPVTQPPAATTQQPAATTQQAAATTQQPAATSNNNIVGTTNVVSSSAITPAFPPPFTPPVVTPIVQAANQQSGGNALSGGAIAGIVIAIVVVVVVLVIVGFVVYRRNLSEQHDTLRTSPVVASNSPVYDPNISKLTIGMTVMARFSQDGREYKAVILQTRPGPQYLIQYVGFGTDMEWLPASSIRQL